MPLISRYDKNTTPWQRTTGIYGHFPKRGYKGYVCIITNSKLIRIWYGGKNPYRPWNGPIEVSDFPPFKERQAGWRNPRVTIEKIQ